MRIFSKKAFAIGPGAQQGSTEINSFVTVPGSFQDMPDKYKDDPTFKLAVKAGDITVIAGVDHQHQVEREKADGKKEADLKDKPSQTATEAFYEELKGMNKEAVYQLAEKYGVEFEKNEQLKNIKKRVFEAYKLAADEEDKTGGSDGDGESEE